MKSWTTVDKTGWGDGPWLEEPDKVQWYDAATGLPCLIVRNHLGALCGYTGVPRGHPLYGADYDSADVDVHGGLTFAGPCDPKATGPEGICHIPDAGEPDDVWWFGFDCAHFRDIAPALDMRLRQVHAPPMRMDDGWADYKTVAYVGQEVTSLARQLAGLGVVYKAVTELSYPDSP